MKQRIEPTFCGFTSYERGTEGHSSDLRIALAHFINDNEKTRSLYYRWLRDGDTSITITKGIHNTEMDKRDHFTFRVGGVAYHAYTRYESLYKVYRDGSMVGQLRKPIIFNVTESFQSTPRFYSSKRKRTESNPPSILTFMNR